VYVREVDGQTLTFAVSGMLWERSLMMIDQETKSLWSHLLGGSMRGKLEGKSLEVLPSLMTDWASWKARYPDTTVAVSTRTAREYRRQMHQSGKPLLIGLPLGKKTFAWTYGLLNEKTILNSYCDGRAVLAGIDKEPGTAVLFDRKLDGKVLTFQWTDGRLVDDSTNSTWDLLTGIATAGDLKDQQLQQLPGILSDAAAWGRFHPESQTFDREK
jgi:hypothetical protein